MAPESAGPYRLRKNPSAVILSIDSLAAAHDGQKLGPRKGSADLSLAKEESLIAWKILRARSFAPLRMTALEHFCAACLAPLRTTTPASSATSAGVVLTK
jgi:hypothetical protein